MFVVTSFQDFGILRILAIHVLFHRVTSEFPHGPYHRRIIVRNAGKKSTVGRHPNLVDLIGVTCKRFDTMRVGGGEYEDLLIGSTGRVMLRAQPFDVETTSAG